MAGVTRDPSFRRTEKSVVASVSGTRGQLKTIGMASARVRSRPSLGSTDDVRTRRGGSSPFLQVTWFQAPPAARTSASPPATPMIPSKPYPAESISGRGEKRSASITLFWKMRLAGLQAAVPASERRTTESESRDRGWQLMVVFAPGTGWRRPRVERPALPGHDRIGQDA